MSLTCVWHQVSTTDIFSGGCGEESTETDIFSVKNSDHPHCGPRTTGPTAYHWVGWRRRAIAYVAV